MTPNRQDSPSWLSWLLGAAILAGVVFLATHFSEQQAFLRLAREAKPWWLFAALALQAATYAAQGEIWRVVARNVGRAISLSFASKLALAKLFVDQALPSAGVSGAVLVAQALERCALPRAAVLAGAVVNMTSFFFAYIFAILASLIILFYFGHSNSVIVLTSAVFALTSFILAAGMLELSGKDLTHKRSGFLRNRVVQNALKIMKDADPRLVRNTRIQIVASNYQLLTFALDALTLWALVQSLGASLRVSHAFATFMIANLVRTISLVPGGLGTFEAAAVLMLKMDGVSVAAGLSTALLFRGLTFFLPMAPGLWFSRHLTAISKSNRDAA